MPFIREYAPREEIGGPVQGRRATADDAGGGAGLVALGRGAQELGDTIVKFEEQTDISDIQAKIAEAHAEFTNSWRDRISKADPSDKALAENFIKDYDTSMEKVADGIGTRAGRSYFTRANAQLRAHFLESAVQGQSVLAGEKAKSDYSMTLNALSSGVISDPTSFDVALTLHTAGVENLVRQGLLPREDAIKIQQGGREQLARNAIEGWIDLNPELGKEQLKSGKWDSFLGGDSKEKLYAQADQAIRAQDLERERQRKETDRVKKEQQEITQNAMLGKLVSGSLTKNDVLKSNLEPFGSGSKEQFLQLMKAKNEDRMKTDPATFRTLFDRIHLPDGDPKKIVDENALNEYVIAGSLSFDDLNKLRGEMMGRKTEAGQIEGDLKNNLATMARNTLTKSPTGIQDPVGDEQYQRFMSFFLTEYSRAKAAGKNPIDLLNPESPEYLGKYVRNYIRTPEQIIQDKVRLMSPPKEPLPSLPHTPAPGEPPTAPPAPQPTDAPTARKPGESPADYLNRIKATK